MSVFDRIIAWPWEIILLLIGFDWLYQQTMPPGISSWIVEGWDSAVLQITGSSWGIPHSPAYPLYTILTNLFVRWLAFIPGLWQTSLAWRVSFGSTVTSLLTLMLLYFTVWKLTHDRLIAWLTSCWLGVSFIFWRAAIMAEVYSFNALIFGLIYWLMLVWRTQRRTTYLIIIGLILGAGVVHHRTALILPVTVTLGMGVCAWGKKSWLRTGKNWLMLVGCSAMMLPTYLYLPWAATHRAGQTWLYADASDWNTFWFMVMSREWWGLVQPPTTLAMWQAALWQLIQQQADQLTWVGLLLGCVGMLLLYRQSWLFWPPLLALSFFGTAYKVADLDSMLIPLTLTLSIGIGVSLHRLRAWLVKRSVLFIYIPGIQRRWIRSTVSGLLSLLLFGLSYLLLRPLAETNYTHVDLSGDWQAEDLVEELVAMAQAGTPLTIIGQDNSVLPDFIYAQVVLGQDVYPLSTTELSRLSALESQQRLRNVLAQGHRLLVDIETIELGFLPWLNEALKSGQILLAPTGHPYLWELLPRPISPDLPPSERWTAWPGGQFVDGNISIKASHQQIVHKRTGCFLRLTLLWQADNPPTEDYYIAYQPLGGEAVLDKVDHLALMRGYLPFSQLQPHELIRDEVDLLIRQPTELPLVDLVINLYQVRGDTFPTFGQLTLPITVDPQHCYQ